MAATTAHTGASRFRNVAIMVPPDWEAAVKKLIVQITLVANFFI